MNLTDYITKGYMNLYRKEKEIYCKKKYIEIPFNKIKIVNSNHKVSMPTMVDATTNANNLVRMNKDGYRKQLATYGYNMVVSDNKDGFFTLLCGAKAYYTLKQTFEIKNRQLEYNGIKPVPPYIKTFVCDFSTREELLDFCKRNFDLVQNYNLDYIDTSDFEEDYDLVDIEMGKIKENEDYNPIVDGYAVDNKLYFNSDTSQAIYFARKYSKLERIKVRIRKMEE